MKKIFVILFSCVFVFIITICTASCNKQPVPCFRYGEYGERERIAFFANQNENGERKEGYEEFVFYCTQELIEKRGEHFYILDPGFVANWGIAQHDIRNFEVYAEAKENNSSLIVESIQLYDREYFDYYENYPELNESYGGQLPLTVWLNYITDSKSGEIDGKDFRLEFGKNSNGIWYLDKFINIYIGKTCVGTCYYHEYVPLTQDWFEKYFSKNLSRR